MTDAVASAGLLCHWLEGRSGRQKGAHLSSKSYPLTRPSGSNCRAHLSPTFGQRRSVLQAKDNNSNNKSTQRRREMWALTAGWLLNGRTPRGDQVRQLLFVETWALSVSQPGHVAPHVRTYLALHVRQFQVLWVINHLAHLWRKTNKRLLVVVGSCQNMWKCCCTCDENVQKFSWFKYFLDELIDTHDCDQRGGADWTKHQLLDMVETYESTDILQFWALISS